MNSFFLFMLISAASLEKRDWLAKAILETRAAASFPSIRPHYHSLLPLNKCQKNEELKKENRMQNVGYVVLTPPLDRTAIVSSPQRMQKNKECKM